MSPREPFLKVPNDRSQDRLAIDANFDALRKHSRFQELIASTT